MRGLINTLVTLILILGLLASPKQAQAQISVFTDFPSFDAATGLLVEIDFENLPINGSSGCLPSDNSCTPIPNPLELEGVVFADPVDLQTGFCSSPTCQPDPDNSFGGNIVLGLNPSGTIDFPDGTGGAMLVIEGIGDNPFQVEVTDFAGSTSVIDGAGVAFDVAFLEKKRGQATLLPRTGTDRPVRWRCGSATERPARG